MTKKGEKIIALRKQGKTHGEIEKILKLPKTTVGWWLRGIKVPEEIKKKMLKRCRKKWSKNITDYNKMYAQIRSLEAARIRDAIKKKASQEIKTLTNLNLKVIGSMLYWAEGNTKNRHQLRFSNSKPEMIKVMMKFFREICEIPDNKIKARVHLHPNIKKRRAIEYWSNVTKLSKSNFHKPQVQISKSSKQKRKTNTLPYGTLHLTTGNTEKTCMVKGWIQGIAEKI